MLIKNILPANGGKRNRQIRYDRYGDFSILALAFAVIALFAGLTGCGSSQVGGAAANPAPDSVVSATPVELDLSSYTSTATDGTTTIHIPAGTYSVSRPIELASDTVLEGEGDSTILQPGSSLTGDKFITNADSVHGNQNITIRNIQISFSGQYLGGNPIVRFQNVDGLDINNITMVVSSPVYAIDLTGQVSNAVIEKCRITNTSNSDGGGIMVRNGNPPPAASTSNIVVRNNQIGSASSEPIAAFGWLGIVENVHIDNNTISAYGASFGISTYGHASTSENGQIRNVEIAGNTIVGSKVGGIGIFGGARQVSAVGNNVSWTAADGIFIDSGGDWLPAPSTVAVLQNTISNTGRHGIYANGADVRLEQNMISNCSGNGVFASAPGIVVVGNTISGASTLITAYAEDDSIIHDNIFPLGGDVLYLH